MSAMTAFRLIPLPIHGALEMVVGLFTMAAPFLLGFGPAATVVGVVVGTLLIGLALATTVDDAGRASLPVSTHHAFDYGFAIGLVLAGALVGVDGDRIAALTFALIGVAQFALNLTTRYSLRG